METFRGVCTRSVEAPMCCHLLRAKLFLANYYHKKIFHVYNESCLSRQIDYNSIQKFSEGRSNVVEKTIVIALFRLQQKKQRGRLNKLLELAGTWQKIHSKCNEVYSL